MSAILIFLFHLAIIAMAFVGGVFLAFSDFIMRALARTSGSGGVEAMQSINRAVFHWIFMALFIGLAPVSLGVALYGLLVVGQGAGAMLALAGAIYLIGCFGVTALCNVPMNTALARMNVAAPATQDYWRSTYLPRWTFWNSVRTVACGASALLMLMALGM